ncbi:RipA family octameric membrane protein [Rubrimonas sp.]|uniref:RipA family octameric membrane protein n=1 Tax=Rubrimonas sp. TaxID=2036015 RepID=UPI003FA7DE25
MNNPDSEASRNKKFDDDFKLCLDISYRMFDKHAQQRVQFFQFFVTVIGFAIAAIGVAVNSEKAVTIIFASLFLFIITCIFQSIEERNKALVKISEKSFRRFQSRLSAYEPWLRIVDISDRISRRGYPSYGKAFRNVFLVTKVFSVLAIIYGISLLGSD